MHINCTSGLNCTEPEGWGLVLHVLNLSSNLRQVRLDSKNVWNWNLPPSGPQDTREVSFSWLDLTQQRVVGQLLAVRQKGLT